MIQSRWLAKCVLMKDVLQLQWLIAQTLVGES